MNIIFTITAHGFEKAAAVEKALKAINMPFESKVLNGVGRRNQQKPRVMLTKQLIATVLHAVNKHPDWTEKEIERETGVGRNTVNKIKRGVHPLQQDVEEIK